MTTTNDCIIKSKMNLRKGNKLLNFLVNIYKDLKFQQNVFVYFVY